MCENMPVKKQETSDERSLSYGRRLASPKPGEEIVISGLSAKFPSCSNAYEIRERLNNKMDLITGECRWVYKNTSMPARVGYIPGAELFDCSAFGITPRVANLADPLLRVLLENAIEAIVDAGINPEDLAGTKTAILGSICNSESGEVWERASSTESNLPGVFVAGRECANVLSYILKVNGPSMICDSACSSTAYCLDQAYTLLRKGKCDAALVFGATILLDPRTTTQFYNLGLLSPEGVCKSLDAAANGYVRSEARCTVFLQRAKDAKRIYAQLIHSKTNSDGFKSEGITFPSGTAQEVLARETYEECGIDPKDVFFLEAHAPGTKVGDPEELNAIDRVFCRNRKEPLLIGSVKANLGHTEPVAALASITKILLGMEDGYIAPNINFKTPRPGVPGFNEGRLKVLLEKLPYKDQNAPVGIGSYGFGGANGHLILRGFNKKEKSSIRFDGLPRLVCFGGRTEATIKNILRDLTERDYDPEYIALLQSVFRKSSSLSHPYRGFAIVSEKGVLKSVYQKQKICNDQLFVILSGLEDGWVHRGRDLIKLHLFKSGLDRASKIISKNGTNITNLLITQDSQFPNKSLFNFIVQIVIIDTLKVIGLRFSKIFAASYGKILAAYYQETITLKEALSVATILEKFANLSTSTNKSNQQSSLQKELDKQFPQTNPFDAKSLLNTNLLPLIKLPKAGTILEFGFGSFRKTTNGKTSDLLQVIDFDSNEADGFVSFLETLGRLYVSGFDMDLEKLYPAIQYPVSRGTPMISPLISWEHSFKKFHVKQFGTTEKDAKKSVTVNIDVSNSEWSFISGHVIDGRILFPATGYIFVVWKELATLKGLTPEEARVRFENVRFKRATPFTTTSFVKLLVTIFEKSGYFEINEGDATIVTGYVKLVMNDVDAVNLPLPQPDPSLKGLNKQDVYKELKLRGYNYDGLFRGIEQLDQSFSIANVQWFKNWVSFMENMLQLSILQNDTRNLYIPTGIDRIVINSVKHMEMLEKFDEPEPLLPVYVYHDINYCRGGYVEVSGVKVSPIPKRKQLRGPVLEKYQFVPNEASLATEEALSVNIEIALENHHKLKVKTVEVFDDDKEPLSPIVLRILEDIPLVEPDVNILTNKELDYPGVNLINRKLVTECGAFIVLGVNVLSKPQLLKDALTAAKDGYIVTRQTTTFNPKILSNNNLAILTSYKTENGQQILARVLEADTKPSTVIKIPSTLDDFSWLKPLQNAIKFKENVILLAQNDGINGILGLFTCIKCEYKSHNIRCVYIQDETVPFDPCVAFYKQQLEKQFAVNIFKAGKWGTYRHLFLDKSPSISDSEHVYVNTLRKGDLSSLQWIEGPLKVDGYAETGKELIQVYYASLNFRDVMTAIGKLSVDVITKYRPDQECVLGVEFAGKDLKGKRVMGMLQGGALSTIVAADKAFQMFVPDQWTLEDAATIPVVYGTVLYALIYRARIKPKQSILIHAGSGGIGQAAIRIALHHGLQVYTTVGSEAKRQFIKDTFPQISDQQIGNSRDTTFEQLIMKQTKGKGVDLVLNSLADKKLLASVRCLAQVGQFIEIGKFDLSQDNPLPLKAFAKGVSHHGITWNALLDQPPAVRNVVVDLIREGIKSGAVKPLNRVVFQKDEIEEAFRYMAAGKHIGKVLIKLREEDEPPQAIKTKCSPRYFCNSEYTQVILGGLGGLGLELADWLVLRGAKKLVLTSRTGVRNGYQASRIRLWRSYGVSVMVATANTATKKGCLELIQRASKMGPIESIFNSAVALQDAILENQTDCGFEITFQPKAITTTYLDEITRNYCPYLRTFVVFSSVSCGRGNAGQTNYGMTNSIMERICEQRKQNGLPGLAIQWGAIADVGLVAEMQRGDVEVAISGTLQQRLASCLQVLDQLLRQNEPVVSSMVVAEKQLGANAGGDIITAVANVLGIKDLKTVSLQASLAKLGMDSIMSVEIKQLIKAELDMALSPEELRELSLAGLREMMEEDKTKTNEEAKDSTTLIDLLTKNIEKQDGTSALVVPLKTSVEASSAVSVIALPGVEGTCSLMANLAAQLNTNVLCCQYLMEQQNSLEEIVDALIQELYNVFKTSRTFKIIGHSFGSTIAIKMAEKLEADGMQGKIVLIDGTPTMTRFIGRGLLDADSYQLLENNVLLTVFGNYLPPETLPNIKAILSASESYKERVDKLFELFPGDKQHYRSYFATCIKSLITRIYAFKILEAPKTKVKAETILCKAAASEVPEGALPDDYGLSDFLETPPKIVTFDGTHVTILENSDLAKCINEFLI